MMRILTITDDLPPAVLGGSGRIALETSVGLLKLGHDVHILTAGAPNSVPAMVDGVQVHTIPSVPRRFAHYRSVFSRKREREVMRVIKVIAPDLIHAHGIAWQIGYRWIGVAHAKNIPVVYTAHGVMTEAYGKVLDGTPHRLMHDIKRARWEYNPLRNFFIRRALAQCESIICVSDALRHFLAATPLSRCVKPHALTVLHNGIDLAFWKETETREASRTQLNIPQDKTVFLFAGRIGHDKGSTALDATLPDNSMLLVAGDGQAASFPKSGQRVMFFPHQSAEQMRLLYCACDAVVVPSIYLDPFPTVCLEAMACSRPVIATCFGGAKEAVANGVTGWVLDPRDTCALHEKLQWCTDHKDDCAAVGKRAREHMEKNFSREMYLEALMTIYRSASSA